MVAFLGRFGRQGDPGSVAVAYREHRLWLVGQMSPKPDLGKADRRENPPHRVLSMTSALVPAVLLIPWKQNKTKEGWKRRDGRAR